MTKQLVMFATPTLSHHVSMEYHRSTIATEWLLRSAGITSGYMQQGGDCFVAKVRSKIATDFLRDHKEFTDLFFLDDDIGWPAEKVLEFLKNPADVICGAYPKKSDKTDFPCGLMFDKETGKMVTAEAAFVDHATGKHIKTTDYYLAKLAPTGFMRIKRHVLEKLAPLVKTFYDVEKEGEDSPQKEFYAFFEAGIGPDKLWWGEDFTFTERCRGIGISIWIDPDIEFTHRGSKKWTDKLANHLDTYREKGRLAAEQERKSKDPENGKPNGSEQLHGAGGSAGHGEPGVSHVDVPPDQGKPGRRGRNGAGKSRGRRQPVVDNRSERNDVRQ